MSLLGKIRSSFKAKVLLPVLAFLIIAPMTTLWVVHHRGTVQFERDTRKKLFAAQVLFERHINMWRRTLISQYRNLAAGSERSGIKAIASLVETSKDRLSATRTMKQGLIDLRMQLIGGDSRVEAALYTTSNGEFLECSADERSTFDGPEIHAASMELIARALGGEVAEAELLVKGRLIAVVSVPVVVSGPPIGALTLVVPIDDAVARQIGELTQSDILFLARGQVVASTLGPRDVEIGLSDAVLNLESTNAVPIVIDREHFQALARPLAPKERNSAELGYILLRSYEESLRELTKTQAALWLISCIGILVSSGVVLLVISRTTDPIRRLRDQVEAVGRGDFSKRLELNRTDELGALARSFNEMTANVQSSRAELERTVDRLKTTQNQLVQSEKLSAVGQFVAGVAHELNNPLTSLIGFAELLQCGGVDEKQESYLNFIVKSSQRCHKIVQSLLSFARQHAPEKKVVKTAEILDAVLELLAYDMRTSNIEVLTRYDSTLPPIYADAHQLQQVILNILNNARQAIQATKKPGQIRLVTERHGEFIRILISDNGPGIAAENVAKIFDPFFTTKPVGQGTGLGLSLCYGIIREHGGSINVSSQLGSGATFTIDIPPAPASALSGNTHDDDVDLAARELAEGKRILVIDDEEWILTLTRKVLEEDGYTVDVATDGESALTVIENTDYDLLICDQKMPGVSGPELYRKLQESHPQTAERLIFMTGDVVGDNFQEFLRETQKTCLTKPFSLTQLRSTVSTAMRTASATGS